MAKRKLLVALSICLLLQFVASIPHYRVPNSLENEDDLSLKQTKSQTPLEEYLASEILPLMVYTAILVDERSRNVIRASNIFLKQAVEVLIKLPLESESIHSNITRFSNLVERIEGIDLDGDSSAVLAQKSTLLKDITFLLADIDLTARGSVAGRDAVFYIKPYLKDFHKNLLRSADTVVHKFSIIFARFWNSLSETGKMQLSELSDWWMHFQGAKSSEEKFKHFAKFFEIFKI
ncbi:uncharacterized protein LOC118736423 [Rhagoletis pomonella]|uniref:uncharacterized protein LOC118736423 n=1 Tax=Rhagoletis pomonella TaxID=28610 RepID=UPI001783CE3F|nr:uncharacterized protein LOC118736423 [Rhagoletis pomonella]